MEPVSHESPRAARRLRGRRSLTRRALQGVVAILVAYLLVAYLLVPVAWRRYAKRHPALADAPRVTHTANGTVAVDDPPDQDARFRRLAVGTWEDDYQGKRTMTLKEDGTGTMVVELSGLKATIFASRLRFDMTWSVENGRLKKRTTGGEPAQQVQLILKTMGDRVEEPILELTPERLLLLDQDGKTKYDWRRVETATAVKNITTGTPPAGRPRSDVE